jgi:hypothetical protein
MKISKLSFWLTPAIALLVLIASSAGLFNKDIYAEETLSWTVQAYGQDIANLIATAALLVATYFAGKGSLKAYLVWIGVLLSLLYPYLIYAFDIHFNSLFLVYVALVGLIFYTLVSSVIHLRLDIAQFTANGRAKVVSGFLMVVAVLFYFLWLSEDIPALLTGSTPQTVLVNGLLTNPVHVLDMALYLPAMMLTAILLWRRKLLGYILALPMLVFSILTGIGILAAFLAMSSKGMPTSLGVELFFVVIILVSLALSVLFITRSEMVRPQT